MPEYRLNQGDGVVVSDLSPLPIASKGSVVRIAGELTRPADTTAYAANDLVGAQTDTGTANVIELIDACPAGDAIRIERVRLAKSTNVTTNAQFRLHFFEARPTLGVGDNGALGALTALAVDATMRHYAGYVDVTINRAGDATADGSVGVAVPVIGTGLTVAPFTGTSIFVVLQALAAYTPASAEVFRPIIEGIRG